MRNTKRLIALVLVSIILIGLLTSCGSSTTNQPSNTPSSTPNSAAPSSGSPTSGAPTSNPALKPTPEDENVKYADHLTYIGDTPVGIINPLSPAGTGQTPNNLYQLIYNTLIEYDEDNDVFYSALATQWETEDWQTFVFHLRNDVYFHNGDHFTAQDVANSVRMGTEAKGASAQDHWRQIETATVIDDYTIELKLHNPDAFFYFRLATVFVCIFNERAVLEDSEKGYWVGTGPWIVTDFSTNDYVELIRNENYWGELPVTKTQTWKNIPEVSTRAIMLRNGEADVVQSVTEGDLYAFRDDSNYTTIPVLRNDINCVFFHTKDPITGDMNFKKAVECAINREEIAQVALGDLYAIPTDGATWGRSTMNRNTDLPAIQQDLERAKEFLEASTYNGEELIITTTRVDNVRAAETLQSQLAAIGVKSRVDQMDQPGFLAHTNGMDSKGQIMIWTAILGPSPNSYGIFRPGNGNNRTMYDNPEFTETVNLAPTITDDAERESMYKRLQEIIYEDKPVIPLYVRIDEFVTRSGVGGLKMQTCTGYYDLRYAYRIIND